MAVTMIYPAPEKGGRGKKSISNIEFSKDYLNKARTVLAALPELAKQVRDGVTSLLSADPDFRIANKLG